MKKYLLKKDRTYHKANLHLHSTISDGTKTPEEVKKFYKDHGYSIIAFTDHDKYFSYNQLSEEDFVVLNGFELEYYITPWRQKTCHLCFIALDKDNEALGYSSLESNPFLRELPEGKKVLEEGGKLYTVSVPERPYDPKYINEDIRKGKELGFYVTYNHPTWSLESYPDYSRYEGMDAMEMVNYGCLTEGYDDDDGRVYDDLLNQGKRIYTIATDDNHNEKDDDGPYLDSFGGYIMLGSEKLEYESVAKALVEGNFYSCGKISYRGECPEIKELYVEDGKVHIECSPVRHIQFIKNIRPSSRIIADRELVCEGTFEIGDCKWFRIVIEDEYGNKAYTNAYFRDEL